MKIPVGSIGWMAVAIWLLTHLPIAACADDAGRYYKITVIDRQTGRGVPLVELRTVNNIRYVTDSGGVVAFYEPGLMGQDVFFFVQSDGYTFPADSFKYHGVTLHVQSGLSAQIKVDRSNIAERLYRVTGEGIYNDTLLVGGRPPITHPSLNAQMTGQDTVMAIPYQGKLYWFWGDTNRPSYPLGNFATSGATSVLPGKGGLDPSVGVNLTYFVNKEGFCRAMAPLSEPGVVWIDGVTTLKDAESHERLVARYERLKELGKSLERGLMQFNDTTQTFERTARFDLTQPLYPQGHPFHLSVAGTEWVYFPSPYPNLRVRATMADFKDPARYEGYTPLVTGNRYDGANTHLDRDATGKLLWAWKRDTPPLSPPQQQELIAAGKIKSDDCPFALHDLDTGASIEAQGGSVYWNAYRKRWIMILVQAGGTSYLGEIWYAEAPAPEGPWQVAKKIVTHNRYTFYNPTQHPFFDQDGGRVIYFEGTYTNQFTGTPVTPATPRYEYNQVMYRLDLADERLRVKSIKTTQDIR